MIEHCSDDIPVARFLGNLRDVEYYLAACADENEDLDTYEVQRFTYDPKRQVKFRVVFERTRIEFDE